jgi:hypothetical protein
VTVVVDPTPDDHPSCTGDEQDNTLRTIPYQTPGVSGEFIVSDDLSGHERDRRTRP